MLLCESAPSAVTEDAASPLRLAFALTPPPPPPLCVDCGADMVTAGTTRGLCHVCVLRPAARLRHGLPPPDFEGDATAAAADYIRASRGAKPSWSCWKSGQCSVSPCSIRTMRSLTPRPADLGVADQAGLRHCHDARIVDTMGVFGDFAALAAVRTPRLYAAAARWHGVHLACKRAGVDPTFEAGVAA